jgi:hypothetical protein
MANPRAGRGWSREADDNSPSPTAWARGQEVRATIATQTANRPTLPVITSRRSHRSYADLLAGSAGIRPPGAKYSLVRNICRNSVI